MSPDGPQILNAARDVPAVAPLGAAQRALRLAFVLGTLAGVPGAVLAMSSGSQAPAQPVYDMTDLTAPSGLKVQLLEKRVDLEGAVTRLRFLAPEIGNALTRPGFEDLGADLEWLCREPGLGQLLSDMPQKGQVIVSLSAKPVEFGVQDQEIFQVFEAFSVQNGNCMLEMF